MSNGDREQGFLAGRRRRGRLIAVALGLLAVLLLWGIGSLVQAESQLLLGGLDYLGAAVCHRITERSFTIAGRQMPLCVRCSGMYLGALLALAVPALAGRSRWVAFPRGNVLFALLALLGLMALDGINSYAHFFPAAPHLYEPRNWLRLVTGMGAGLTLGTASGAALGQTLWRGAHWRPAIQSLGELAGLLLLAAVVVLLTLSNDPGLRYVLSVASGAGLLLTLGAINTILVVIALRREGRADTWRAFLLPLSLGVALAIVELSAGAALRLALFGTLTGLPGL